MTLPSVEPYALCIPPVLQGRQVPLGGTWSAPQRMGRYRRQSSAKRRTDEVTTLGRSFICNKNKRGPKTVPCGTLDNTLAGLECLPSVTSGPGLQEGGRPDQNRTVHAVELQLPQQVVVWCGRVVPRQILSKSPKWLYLLEFCGAERSKGPGE